MVQNSSYYVLFFKTTISIIIIFLYKWSLYTSTPLSLLLLWPPCVQFGGAGHCGGGDKVIKQAGRLEVLGQKQERRWAVWLNPFHCANHIFYHLSPKWKHIVLQKNVNILFAEIISQSPSRLPTFQAF